MWRNARHFYVVADFVQPCSYCGVPCTGTVLIWYDEGDARAVFETDTGSLLLLLDDLIGIAIDRGEYESLPSFAREWNECRGWKEAGAGGAAIGIEDLFRTLDALDARRSPADERGGKVLAGLRAFVERAASAGGDLWAVEA